MSVLNGGVITPVAVFRSLRRNCIYEDVCYLLEYLRLSILLALYYFEFGVEKCGRMSHFTTTMCRKDPHKNWK